MSEMNVYLTGGDERYQTLVLRFAKLWKPIGE